MFPTQKGNFDNLQPYDSTKIVQIVFQIQELIWLLFSSKEFVLSTLGTGKFWLFGYQLLFCVLTILVFIIRRKFSLRIQYVLSIELVIIFGFLFLQFVAYYNIIIKWATDYQTYLSFILLPIDFVVFQSLSLFLLLIELPKCPERSISSMKDDKSGSQTLPSRKLSFKETNVFSSNLVKSMFTNLKLRAFSLSSNFSKYWNCRKLETLELNRNSEEMEGFEMKPLKPLGNQEISEHKSESQIYESLETVWKAANEEWSLKKLISTFFKKIFSNWCKKRENMKISEPNMPPPLPPRNKATRIRKTFEPSSFNFNELQSDEERVASSFTERSLGILRSMLHRNSFSKFTSLWKSTDINIYTEAQTSQNICTEAQTSQNIYTETQTSQNICTEAQTSQNIPYSRNIAEGYESDLDSNSCSNANLKNSSETLSLNLTAKAVSEDKEMYENKRAEPVSTMHQEIYQISENEIKVVTTRKTKLEGQMWKEEVRESIITLKPKYIKKSKEN